MSSSSPSLAFHRNTSIADIITLCPDAQGVLKEYGLSCVGCAGSTFETLEQGCSGHGFGDDDIDALVEDLNDLVKKMPPRAQVITVTLPAAEAIRGIAESEGKAGEGLVVTVDGTGGFCMEFHKDPEGDELIFFHKDAADVRIFASPLTLQRIGGATIDYRDERFKLDLPEDAMATACGCGGACDCKAN